jgi:hypothetical protein
MEAEAGSDFDSQLSVAQEGHDAVKAVLLKAGTRGELDFDTIVACMEMLGEWLRLIQHWIKAMKQLGHIATQTSASDKAAVVEAPEPEVLPSQEAVTPDKVPGSGSPGLDG